MAEMDNTFPPEPPAGLLDRVRAGDDPAFEALYRLYAGRAYTLAHRMLGQREPAEEVLQEVFMDLVAALAAYRGDGPFWAWLRRMVVNRALMRMRSERSRPRLVAVEDGHDSWLDEVASRQYERVHQARDLDAALAQLSPVSRAVVWLHDVEGWTHPEIAAAMDRSVSFSKSQLARAHARLRDLLSQEVLDESGYGSTVGAA
jgi:RNA polymerase sigma factor (sigma-70 family)